MWLLNASSLQLEEYEGAAVPKYAILSHRWEEEEVSFKLMQKGRAAKLKGFKKIRECCRWALANDIAYVWIDTCCIDKRSSSELSEAINNMYRWYREASVCYVYLSDVVARMDTVTSRASDRTIKNFTQSVWFTRGWTLQELLAPSTIFFFDQKWTYFGSKADLADTIEGITGIPSDALKRFVPRDHPVAIKMSWAAGRQTTRSEDRAYSLFGLFDINMPLLYGEGGDKAFTRLQQEIIGYSDDASIFIYPGRPDPSFGMLAATPDSFVGVAKDLGKKSQAGNIFTISKEGLLGHFPLLHYALDVYAAELASPGQAEGCGMYVFVRWNFRANCYERVILDEQNYVLRNFVHWTIRGNTTVAGEGAIKIGRLVAQKVSSTNLPSMRLEAYVDRWDPSSSTQCVCAQPGRFYRTSIPNIDKEKVSPRSSLYINSADGGSEDSDMLSDCLCVGAVSTAFLWQSYRGFHPTATLRIAMNMAKQPVVLLSRLKNITDLDKNLVIHRECDISGSCWYMSPQSYAKQQKQSGTLNENPGQYELAQGVNDDSHLGTYAVCIDIANLLKIYIVKHGIGYNGYLKFPTQIEFLPDPEMVYRSPAELSVAALPQGWIASSTNTP